VKPVASASERRRAAWRRREAPRRSSATTRRRQAFTQLLSELPQATWDIKTTIYEDDVMLLEWGAEGGGNRVEDGIDTFVFRDGLIRVQTVRYTLQPAR
jgi:hypothetical protein